MLVVGASEPEVPAWLRAAGHAARAASGADAASAALDEGAADLVIVDRETGGLEVAACCATLREDHAPRGRLAAGDHGQGPDGRRGAEVRRRRLPAPAVHPRRAARPGARRAARGAAARRRQARPLADGPRPRRDLPLRVARRPHARAHQRRDRADLGLPAAQLHRQREADDHEHRPPRRPRGRDARRRGGERRAATPFELEYRIVRADGEVRWVLDRGQPVPGPGGRMWMDGAIVDITERRAAEEALRQKEIDAARTEELRASRVRIVQAADAARRRIERDLHDGAQQRLVSIALEVRLARSQVEKDPAKAPAFLERFGDELAGGVGRAARAGPRHPPGGAHRARPRAGDRGARRPRAGAGGGARRPGERLPPTVETTAYFTVAEALTNVAKYADASQATVRVAREAGDLVVEVRDDGVGGARPGLRLGPERAGRPGRGGRRRRSASRARRARGRPSARCSRSPSRNLERARRFATGAGADGSPSTFGGTR